MSYESVRLGTIDSGENASQPARRMPATDSQARGRPPGPNSRAPLPMGEIIEVEGGHIVRSTGRKDRHSKVYTAKGPRDRRVRLSASTAIQFYDLQDRLGYDRPSKAVAWLIEKAKASIDELARLPEIRPPFNLPGDAKPINNKNFIDEDTEAHAAATTTTIRDEHSRALARERARERAKERTQERDARDAVAKAAVENNNNNTQFSYLRGNYNLFSNASSHINATNSLIQALQLQNSQFHPMNVNDNININQTDSRNLLQIQQQNFYQSLAPQNFSAQFETPGVVFCEAENSTIAGNHHHHQTQQGLFSGPAYSVPAGISEHHHEFGGDHPPPQRILKASYPWTNTNNGGPAGPADFGPFGTNVGSLNIPNQNSFAIRGTLQSSSSPVRARPAHDLSAAAAAAAADQILRNHATVAANSTPFASPGGGGGGFSGFRIPARIQGIDDDVKPSAASSTSQM